MHSLLLIKGISIFPWIYTYKLAIVTMHAYSDQLCTFNRLVSGSGDIKLTKDGNVLLHEMVSSLQLYLKFAENLSLK